MKISLYSRFESPGEAERALAALTARSVESKDVAVVYPVTFPVEDTAAVPPLGLVGGNSPLAVALLAWVQALASGALADSLPEYLTDYGVPEPIAREILAAVRRGCAVLALQCPTGTMGEFEVTELVTQFHGKSLGRSGHYGKPVVRK